MTGVAALFWVLLIQCFSVIGVEALSCKGLPSFSRHVVPETARGECHILYRYETAYECCRYCEQTWNVWAAQLLLPGQKEPFKEFPVSAVWCCCYTHGRVIQGSDGTQWYFTP